jgi:hypothetical protein
MDGATTYVSEEVRQNETALFSGYRASRPERITVARVVERIRASHMECAKKRMITLTHFLVAATAQSW